MEDSKLSLLFTEFLLHVLMASVGINYGQITNNLPSPEHVVPLVKAIGATRVKLYDADPKCYLPATKITSIVVGNEVLTCNDTSLSGCLLPAMQSVHTTLVNLKLDSQISSRKHALYSSLINAYPFFAYKADLKQVSLDFVMFQIIAGIVDPCTKLHCDNMLFSQIDAFYAAISSLGYKKLPVQISKTGWLSKGDEDEVGASPENEKKYNEKI
ncbi:unnamed protein product [Lactuca virosa]|uniref:Glucan endo-1,3-beta-D-glucosidase n=1 Tax=Lactuca virosa TaxID=75947 RepID=A0AAU9NDP0_9ASTR|nr:unnamed protein product [Lactuca virosa]